MDNKDEDYMKSNRNEWKNSCDFFVTCLSYAVGLGNVWRFPFLCYEYGGGSFLIPYFTMLFAVGLPIYLLEMTLGQYSGVGPLKTFGYMVPLLRGLGFAMASLGMLFAFFYIVVVSWAMWYLFASFQIQLPWSTCDHEYNSPTCYTGNENHTILQVTASSAAEEYFRNNVLGSEGRTWTNFGHPRILSVMTLFLSWSLIAACLIKGVRASGKVVYFTAIFPYVVLTSLAIRSLTLPGASTGLRYYLSPKWSNLYSFQVWTDAATQVIFSLGPGCGCVITLSSYNKFSHNCARDALLITIANSLTSFFSGLVVFSVLGFMAVESGRTIDDVVQSGPGLAFIVYPEVVTKMSLSHLWSILFFSMLIVLAMGSIFGAFETVTSAMTDLFPELQGLALILFTKFLCSFFNFFSSFNPIFKNFCLCLALHTLKLCNFQNHKSKLVISISATMLLGSKII